MRFLLDEALAPSVGDLLRDTGHDVTLVRHLGLRGANDSTVMRAAHDDDRVLVTLDTDFGSLLAHSGDRLPSVILFRGDVTRRPAGQAAILLANLDQFEADLIDGALVVIGDNRIRVRRLPI